MSTNLMRSSVSRSKSAGKTRQPMPTSVTKSVALSRAKSPKNFYTYTPSASLHHNLFVSPIKETKSSNKTQIVFLAFDFESHLKFFNLRSTAAIAKLKDLTDFWTAADRTMLSLLRQSCATTTN